MIKGIDISEWQTDIDYMKLKQQGIEFAIIRCGYGKNASQKDKMFEKHYAGLKYAGIKIGCYLYSYCNKVENAVLEARNCLEFIKGKQFELPVFYDLEDKITKPCGRIEITQMAINFCEEIEKAGYKSGIYANLDWFTNLIDINKVSNYKIWLAQWTTNPTKNFHYDYWQYTDKGQINGINGNVDMNYCYDNISNIVENVDNFVEKSIEELANEVIKGKWGNGEERKQKLTNAGYNYQEVQNKVNEILGAVGNVYYIVKSGDNLTKIAGMYGTSVLKLVQLNNIKNPNLIFPRSKIKN